MFNHDTAHIFIPCWRDGRLLFFTDVKEGYTNRLDYRVAAATAQGSDKVIRTHKAPIKANQLAKCQATADDGPRLQRFFQLMGSGNIGHLIDEVPAHLPPCAEGTSPLIFTCSYLNLLRKYTVDQQIVANYEARTRADRFAPEMTLSIYKILSAHLQPERASALIDADFANIKKPLGSSTAAANLLREAAIIKFDVGALGTAETLMQRAIKLHDTEDKWRRLADFSIASKQLDRAIECFAKAESAAPLPPAPSLRMAQLLVDQKRFADAEPFLARVELVFPKPAKALRQKIAATASAH